ncbi:hypothetical protein CCP4SC76_1080015 [Gammaproteobacteria bacterium]
MSRRACSPHGQRRVMVGTGSVLAVESEVLQNRQCGLPGGLTAPQLDSGQIMPATGGSLGVLAVVVSTGGGWCGRASTLGTVASDAPQAQNGAVGGFSRSHEGQSFTRTMIPLPIRLRIYGELLLYL